MSAIHRASPARRSREVRAELDPLRRRRSTKPIDRAAANARVIRCYEAAGLRPRRGGITSRNAGRMGCFSSCSAVSSSDPVGGNLAPPLDMSSQTRESVSYRTFRVPRRA